MKKFFQEFKTFIARGNVLDMSVGVIVGGAFTAIVNGLTNFILKPLVNWIIAHILGDTGLESAVTILSPAYVKDSNGVFVLDPETNKKLSTLPTPSISIGAHLSAQSSTSF